MTEAPNPLPGDSQSPEADFSRRMGHPSVIRDGSTREITVSRVLRVQLADLSEETWTRLRAMARESAQFCNAWLADAYAQRLGYAAPEESVFVRMRGTLSGDVRVALGREAFTTWRKYGSKILSGAQRLALFDADRAIVCRAEHMSKGRRQIHAWVEGEPGGFRLSLPLRGKDHGGREVFALSPNPKADDYVTPVLHGLASRAVRLLKVTLIFERPGRKVFALLTYEKPVDAPSAGASGVATLGPLEPDGSLWLRWTDQSGRPGLLNLTGAIATLIHMKTHFGGIHRRLRARTRRSGSGCRQSYRRGLVKAGSFGEWAKGPLHQMSASVVQTCLKHGVGALAIGPMEHRDLPMAALVALVTQKATDLGIVITRFDPAQPSTSRAITRPVEKQRKGIVKQREALRTLRDGLQERKTA